MRLGPFRGLRRQPAAPARWNAGQGKPQGMAWAVFMVYLIEWRRPEQLADVTERIADEISRHYQVAAIPIAPTAPCPLTGLSWAFALDLVEHGTLDGRPWAAEIPVLDTRVAWRAYHDEIQQTIEAGAWVELGHPGQPPADLLELIPPHHRPDFARTR